MGESRVDIAMGLLRQRQWAGPETNANFERFIMSEMNGRRGRDRVWKRWLVLAIAGVSLTAAAAVGVSNRWLTYRAADGTERQVIGIDNEDGTMTLIHEDGNHEIAHVLQPPAPAKAEIALAENQSGAGFRLQVEVAFTAARVGGTVLDEYGNEIAVTHDLSDPSGQVFLRAVPTIWDGRQVEQE